MSCIPQGVRLIAELCLYYGIGDGELWAKTLEKLYELAMVYDICKLLPLGS